MEHTQHVQSNGDLREIFHASTRTNAAAPYTPCYPYCCCLVRQQNTRRHGTDSPAPPALLPAGRRPVLPAHQELDGDGGGPAHARPAACGMGVEHVGRAGGASARGWSAPHAHTHTHTHTRYPPSRHSTSMKASPPPDSRLRDEGAGAATTAAGFCCSSPAAAAVCTRRLPLQPLLMALTGAEDVLQQAGGSARSRFRLLGAGQQGPLLLLLVAHCWLPCTCGLLGPKSARILYLI